MATYYISDLHFGHKNVLAYDNREFSSIEEHDKALIDNWNSVVGTDDDVWVRSETNNLLLKKSSQYNYKPVYFSTKNVYI